MSTRLSSLLVQASVVSVRQIERALQRQVLRGGQLDTNLLELGVSEQEILPHLGRARDLEPAARSVWPLPQEEILALIPGETAQACEVAPLGKEGGRLYVLSHESFDAALLAELSGRVGLAVVPVIIPEFRVQEALERYYRIPMPPRSATLAARFPIPEPAWEEVREDLPWVIRPHSGHALSAISYTASGAAHRAQPLAEAGEDAPATLAEPEDQAPSPESAREEEAPATLAKPEDQAPSPALPKKPVEKKAENPARSEVSLSRFTRALDAASHRDQILLEALLFAQRPGQSILLFQVQAQPALAIGRDLLRPGHPPAQIQGASIPLESSPILRRALHLKAFQSHIPMEDTSLLNLFGALSVPPPALIFVLPIVLRDRVVALLLGGEAPDSDLNEIAPVGPLISRALLGLIRKNKVKAASPSATKEPPKAAQGEAPSAATQQDDVVEPQGFDAASEGLATGLPHSASGAQPAQDAIPSPLQANSEEITVPRLEAVKKPLLQAPGPGSLQEEVAWPPADVTEEGLAALEETVLEEDAQALLAQGDFTEQGEPAWQENAANGAYDDQDAQEDLTPRAHPRPQDQAHQNEETILEESISIDEEDEIEPDPPKPLRPLPVALPAELLLQTERLEQESAVLSTLAELIQTRPKKTSPKEPPATPRQKPSPLLHEEIKRLVDLIDLGKTLGGAAASPQELNGAAEKLLSFGEPALARLIEIFPGRRPPSFTEASRPEEGGVVRVLLRFGGQALPALSQIAQSADSTKRLYATWCVASMKNPEILPILVGRLFDEEPLVFQLASNGLFTWRSRFPEHPAFELIPSTLEKALYSNEPGYRLVAARSARELRLVTLLPALVDLLEDPEQVIVEAAYHALVNLTFQNFGVKKKAWLSWIEKNRHRPRESWLIEALSDREAEVRKAAASELYYLTRLTFGYDPQGPKSERKKAIKQWEDWLSGQRS